MIMEIAGKKQGSLTARALIKERLWKNPPAMNAPQFLGRNCMDRLIEKNIERNNAGFKEIISVATEAIKSGMFGFATFFTILLATKYIAVIIGTQEVFRVDFDDVLLSSIGFVLLALIQILEQFRDKNPS